MTSVGSEDNYAGSIQEFLVCTTVHKARDVDLRCSNSELYFSITLGKASKMTKTFEHNEHVFYNESFVFEIKTSLFELLRLTIFYDLKKHATCRKDIAISQLLIDLHTVWHQPKHSFFKKWGRLEIPIAIKDQIKEDASGYLQIDLAIVTQNCNPMHLLIPGSESSNLNKWKVDKDYDDIEKNLLQNSYSQIQCNIRYIVSVYHGYFVRNSDYYIQYRFHPFKGKTETIKNTDRPIWNEELSFAWIFPSLAQQFLIQIYTHDYLQWKPIAECEIHFGEIAFNGTPSLGPTFIHLYDISNPLQYCGRILIEIRSELLNEKVQRQLYTRATWALDESRFWQTERMQIDFLPIQGDFIHASASSCKLGMRIAEHTSNNVDCVLKTQMDKFKLSPNLRFFRQDIPYKTCIINALMPDNRSKFESDFFMQEVVDYMKSEIETFRLFQFKYNNQFHMQTRSLKSILSGILQKIRDGVTNKRFDYKVSDKRTPWEMNRQLYLIDYFAKLPIVLTCYRKKIKDATMDNIEIIIDQVLGDLVQQTSRLNSLVAMIRIQDDWPELVLAMSVSSKDIGLCRLNAKHFLDMHKSNSTNHCWNVRTFIFKDPQCRHTCVNCGCIVATVLGCLAIVNEKERADFLLHIKANWLQEGPMQWTPKVTLTHFKCNLFIHQAKVRPGLNRSSLCNALLRVVTCEHVAETHVVHGTLSPIWNIVITLPDVLLPGDISWYLQNPPLISIEFFDADKSKSNNLVGCGMLLPSIISSDRIGEAQWEDSRMPNYTFGDFMKSKNAVEKFQRLKNATPPPLKWVPMAKKGCTYAEVLMSAEFVEVMGERCDSVHVEGSIAIGIPRSIRPNMVNFVLEVIFIGLRNYSKSDPLSAGRHRIKIMMADLMLVSGLSTSRIHNSFNFLVAYASGVVNLPDQIEYWPGIVAIDVTIKGSDTEHINGAALVPNSKDFLHKNNNDIKCSSLTRDTQTSDTASMTATNITCTSIAIREETEDETESEDEIEPLPKESSKYHNCWTVLKIWFGFKPKYKRAKLQTAISEDWDKDTSEFIGERDLSWWAKFYNSMYPCAFVDSRKHHLIIYTNELEKQSEFSGFKDWAIPIDLIEGIGTKPNAPPKEEIYATLKMQISLTPCHLGGGEGGLGDQGGGGDASSIPISQVGAAMLPKYRAKIQKLGELTNIYVRVYVVQALQLNSRDIRSKSDSYVKLTLGSKTFSDRASYVPNQSNPIFGRFFEFDCHLPHEHILEIKLIDHDLFRDNLIGITYIDLENRWHSKHRATVGIANEYSKSGYNMWRNADTPVELLNKLCHQEEIEPPMYFGKYVEVDNSHFTDNTIIATDEDMNERLALTVLKNMKQLSSFRYSLVPEHVETRSLYRDDCPGIEQGKLQLWVELFDSNKSIPEAIDITPYPPLDFEVRIIILNLEDVPILDDDDVEDSRNLLNDIYVVGWCQDATNYQSTDVHYHSYAGEANFNWRMIFPMKYSPHEDMMMVRCKMDLAEEFEMKLPPTIFLHVKDKEYISHDDYVSSLQLNLSNMPAPFKSASDCQNVVPQKHKHLNLFKRKSVRGWFPLNISSKLRNEDDNIGSGGKIQLEIQVCKQDEALSRPVGLGRQPPNALAAPKRNDATLNPMKSEKKTHWPRYVGIFVCTVLGCVLLFLAAIF